MLINTIRVYFTNFRICNQRKKSNKEVLHFFLVTKRTWQRKINKNPKFFYKIRENSTTQEGRSFCSNFSIETISISVSTMSSFSAECWDFSGRKPSFSQTCTRLSRYLKEKGSFGDLSLGMTCKPDVNGNQPFSFRSVHFVSANFEFPVANYELGIDYMLSGN